MRAAAPPLQGGPPPAPRIQPEPRVQLEVAPDAVLTGSVEASHAPAASSDVVATVVVRGGAFLLHAVLPLSMAVVLGVVTGLLPRALPWPLVAWAVAEVVFYVYFRWRHAHAQRAVPVRSGMGTLERRALLQRCIGVIDDGGAFLSGWFQGHPASDIPFGNAQRWLAWAFFEDDWDALSPADMAEVDTLLHHFEQHAGIVLRPGYNPELKPIRLTLDDVHAVHKPALYYAALSLAHAAFVLWMRAHGAQRGTAGLLTYWHFQPHAAPSSTSANANANVANAVPIVFFHGMGVGPAVYVQLIVQLLRLHVPLYIVELPHISSALSDVVPARADILDGTAAMLHAHGHGRAVFLGHSMGTGTGIRTGLRAGGIRRGLRAGGIRRGLRAGGIRDSDRVAGRQDPGRVVGQQMRHLDSGRRSPAVNPRSGLAGKVAHTQGGHERGRADARP